VAAWAAQCRFNDCSHTVEPGCAVRANVDEARLKSYFKLQRELAAVANRSNVRVRRELKRRWRMRTREMRADRRRGRY
jgi:ribosome biogenesis GTPase